MTDELLAAITLTVIIAAFILLIVGSLRDVKWLTYLGAGLLLAIMGSLFIALFVAIWINALGSLA